MVLAISMTNISRSYIKSQSTKKPLKEGFEDENPFITMDDSEEGFEDEDLEGFDDEDEDIEGFEEEGFEDDIENYDNGMSTLNNYDITYDYGIEGFKNKTLSKAAKKANNVKKVGKSTVGKAKAGVSKAKSAVGKPKVSKPKVGKLSKPKVGKIKMGKMGKAKKSKKSKKSGKKTESEPEERPKKKDQMDLIYFLVYTIPFCLAYIFALRPSWLTYFLEASKGESTKLDIQINNTLLMCVFFFVLVFYTTTTLKNYYGGTQWIKEPVSLLIPVEYLIEPSYEYTLSYWVYLDAVPPEYSFRASLFNNLVTMGPIQTLYQPSTNTLRINIEDVSMPRDIPILTQTWNHIVLVGTNGQLDVYVNGNLKYTTHSVSKPNESLFIGQEEGGKGKICNVVYSPKAVSELMVQQMYMQLRLQSPPVI